MIEIVTPMDDGNENRLKIGKYTSRPAAFIGTKQTMAPTKPTIIASISQVNILFDALLKSSLIFSE